MRWVLSGAAAVAAVVLLTACSPEDSTQRAVRQEVERRLTGDPDYEVSETHCTSNPRPWFVEEQASIFYCAVRRAGGGCDWFKATIEGRRLDVVLDRPDAGCILPA